jgi:hypothetical protein
MDCEEKASSCGYENEKMNIKRKVIIKDIKLNVSTYKKEYINLIILTYAYRVAIVFHSM